MFSPCSFLVHLAAHTVYPAKARKYGFPFRVFPHLLHTTAASIALALPIHAEKVSQLWSLDLSRFCTTRDMAQSVHSFEDKVVVVTVRTFPPPRAHVV